MTWRLAVLLLVVVPVLGAAEPQRPGPEIATLTDAVAWAPLLASLAAKGAVYSTFTEQRYFPFRRTPVILEGELRYAPGLGLSLRYTAPDDRTLILDQEGMVMRDGRGRQRIQPANARIPDLVRPLLTLMQFDEDRLLEAFTLHGARDADDWRIDLDPRSREEAKVLGSITVFGRGDDIRHLVFRRGVGQRVEIFIRQSRPVAAFPAEERRKYFR